MISILISVIMSFLAVYLLTPKYILFLEKIGMTGTDIQKRYKPVIAEMAGPLVVFGFIIGIFAFVWMMTFVYGGLADSIKIFAGISTILLITLVGMFDDLSGLMRKNPKFYGLKRIGLRQWQKPLLTLFAAIPLMAIMAGDSTVAIPLVGDVNLGVLFPLMIIPIAIVGASNATNMLAGMNGLEAGLGVVLLSSLGAYSYFQGSIAAAIIAFTVAASLLAFLKFNWYPARIMPGDSLTYMVGATVATVAIIGNIEKFAVLAFLPWFVEFALKLRSRFKAESFGVIQSDGTLKASYEKNYSLTHVVMHAGKFREWQIVGIMILVELALCASLLLIYL